MSVHVALEGMLFFHVWVLGMKNLDWLLSGDSDIGEVMLEPDLRQMGILDVCVGGLENLQRLHSYFSLGLQSPQAC